MGRRKSRRERRMHQDAHFDKGIESTSREDSGPSHHGAKQLSKKQKKQRKNIKRRQIPITKEHRWYRIKVCDSTAPGKDFLRESFGSLLDTEFTMLGFHVSQHSSRFYLENNSAAATAIAALNKRMQGVEGRLMQIASEPCNTFLLLNVQQMAVVKQVLEKRYDVGSGILDLTRFHYDPVFLNENILPVLWDPAILRQVLSVVKEIGGLQGLVLSHNSLKLSNVKVISGTLSNCGLKGLNLEHNEIENVKDLIIALGVFPLLELKLEGNNCLRDIKDPVLYIKTVLSKLDRLKTLDGVDIATYLASKNASSPLASKHPPLPTAASMVAQPQMVEFLKEFYACIDSEHRQQLVNAFLPNASFAIQSEVTAVPSGECVGHNGIQEALQRLPPSKHDTDSFVPEFVKCEPTEGQVKVAGRVQIQEQECSFVHAFSIVPYNSGLGCSMCVLGYR